MTEYTKGEWKAVKDTNGRTHLMAFDSDGAERNIAILSVRSVEQTEADAHLIAAAPAMYEALKAIINNQMLRKAGNFTECGILQQIDQALAKAEGKGGDARQS